MEAAGYDILGSQVSVNTSLGRRVYDFVIASEGRVLGVEVKSGGAIRSAVQCDKDIEIAREGGQLVGKNADRVLSRLGDITAKFPTWVIRH